MPLVDPEKKDTFKGPPLGGSDVKGSGGFRSLHGSSNAIATQELPLASGCWAQATLPPSRLQLSFQTNREALPTLQLMLPGRPFLPGSPTCRPAPSQLLGLARLSLGHGALLSP